MRIIIDITYHNDHGSVRLIYYYDKFVRNVKADEELPKRAKDRK